MINSHLLYRLSYRGTTIFHSLLPDRLGRFPYQRRAILRAEAAMSTLAASYFITP